jgi:hypothetical protein
MIAGVEAIKIFEKCAVGGPEELGRFGIDIRDIKTLERAYNLPGLVKTISDTYHLAQWRTLVTETKLVKGPVYELALDLTTGPADQITKLIYFPEIWLDKANFFPQQSGRVYVSTNRINCLRNEGNGLVLTECKVVKGGVALKVRQSEKYDKMTPKEIVIFLRSGKCEVKYPDQELTLSPTGAKQPTLFF